MLRERSRVPGPNNDGLVLSPNGWNAAAQTSKHEPVIPAHTRYDRSDFFWLCYLLFFFIEPIARNNPVYWMKSLTAVGFFFLLYFAALRFANLRLRIALLAGMAILGAACFPWNGGGPTFTIYSAALLPFMSSYMPLMFSWFFVASGMLALVGWRFHLSPYAWLSDILLIWMVGGANVFFAQKMRADCKLRMKQEEIEALAAVAERERIARDLHDVLGHTLSLIVLKAELAGRLLDRELTEPTSTDVSSRPQAEGRRGETPAFASARTEGASQPSTSLLRARAELGEVERTARTALAEVREAIGGYRARGLAAEIESARSTLATAGVTLTTDGDLQPASLTAAEETVLALALREAVTNIVRHAQATTCHLRLVVASGHHRLSIQDNGNHPATHEGNGLRGMRERIESLGGQLSLTREQGTHLQIELPLRTHAAT